MRPSFLTLKKPIVCSMIECTTLEAALAGIRNDEQNGADGFGVNAALLPTEVLEGPDLKKLIHSTGLPMMLYSYRNHNLADRTDEYRGQLQLRFAENGAACCDVMGDLFCPSEREFTMDPTAVEKQRQLIRDIHSVGAEVIISSHMPVSRTAEQVLEQMSLMRDRGADIAKMVTTINTQEEFTEAVRAMTLLNEKLGIPYIYLCNGKFATLMRHMCVHLGALLSFSVPYYGPTALGSQPLTRDLRHSVDAICRRTSYPED